MFYVIDCAGLIIGMACILTVITTISTLIVIINYKIIKFLCSLFNIDTQTPPGGWMWKGWNYWISMGSRSLEDNSFTEK